MNKFIQVLRLICAITWLGALAIALFKPELNYRTCFILAATSLVITYGTEFAFGGDTIARQIKEFNTEQGRNTEFDNKSEL